MFKIDPKEFVFGRLKAISEAVNLICTNGTPGDMAEFGIMSGNSLQVIAATMSACDPISERLGIPLRHFHGFDSFQGMPEATLPGDIDSPMVQSGVWGPGTCSSPGLDAILALAKKQIAADRIHLYPGWFADTLPKIPDGTKFALIHLDCDFYESTMQVLDGLFGNDRLSDGCILLFDDYLENRGSKKMGQRKAWEECKIKYKPDFTDIGFYGKGCWHCVIHNNSQG